MNSYSKFENNKPIKINVQDIIPEEWIDKFIKINDSTYFVLNANNNQLELTSELANYNKPVIFNSSGFQGKSYCSDDENDYLEIYDSSDN